MSYDKPLPIINEDNTPYWGYAREHQLRMQKCANCGYIRFPVSIVCPRCHSLEMEWTKLSGRGKVYSYIIYHQAYHPAYKDDIPYVVAIIQLDEGPRMESNITDCRLEDLRVGMPVELYFDDVTEDVSLPKFRPAEGGQQ
jgi:uncharacterized OB-fold protein